MLNNIPRSAARLAPLEACRGIAAMIVLIHHFLLGFALGRKEAAGGWWFNIFINGTGAVLFFFTLSGFVLCWQYFHSDQGRPLLPSILKRWPRLAMPVIISTLISWAIFKLGWLYFEPAAILSKSPWLQTFGYANWPANFQMSIEGAIVQGVTTFFTGIVSYNSSLWTMKPEFIGSIIVYLLATFLYKNEFSKMALISLFLLIIFWTLALYPYLFPFALGIFLASSLARYPLRINTLISFVILGVGLYLLGYEVPEKNYAWVSMIEEPLLIAQNIKIILLSFGAVCVIFSVMTNDAFYRFLDHRFSAWLGKISFPLYLIHVLVITSFGSWFYIYLMQEHYALKWVFILNFLATFTICLLLCLPLMWLDQLWVRYLNRFTAHFSR